jgi:hypothetical protein
LPTVSANINFQVDIEYDDVARTGWKTTALFASGLYEGTCTEERERACPISDMIKPALPGASE